MLGHGISGCRMHEQTLISSDRWLVVGAFVIVIYCFSGGIRASIWTDAAQSLVMMASMAVLLFMAATQIGGPTALLERLTRSTPA
jgi:sodium/proline symporter